ncbi:uncharacterized protein LOC108680228 [Hyalella azteca]|uniref:Uncharacterized protein LOC108680228 n=1 Tax=Hyalella azteca TaxID=294128 RepID=A0A8B7PEG5_HYAAZ|nr:uncharacterized protein LOC108680228 [Hyalella azteca]
MLCNIFLRKSLLRYILLLLNMTHVVLSSHPLWTIQDCDLPTGIDHPVGLLSANILNLARMTWVSDSFWMEYSWNAQPQYACGLQNNVLYFVQKKQSGPDKGLHFTFTTYSSYNDWRINRDNREKGGQEIICPGTIVALDKGSYGFASCEKDYSKVLAASQDWRAGVPQSFFLILLGVVSGLILLVAVVAIVALIISKKKFTGFFSLHNHRLDTSLAPPATTFEPPNI